MSISSEQALAALRLPPEALPSRREVLEAFARLSRRYPLVSFPERFGELLAARDALLDPARDLRDLFTARQVDLTWLPALAQTKSVERDEDGGRELLLDMLRKVFVEGDGYGPDESGLGEILDSMDPEMLEAALRELGIFGGRR